MGRVRERKASEPVGRAVNREGGDEYDHGGRSPRLAKKSPKARVSGLPVFEVMGTIMNEADEEWRRWSRSAQRGEQVGWGKGGVYIPNLCNSGGR